MSALRLIKQSDITSSVASLDMTDIFSDTFDVYKIVSSNLDGDTTVDLNVNVINSSGTVSNSNYEYSWYRLRNDTFSDVRSTSATTWQNGFGQSGTEGASCVSYVLNPFSSSSYTFMLSQAGGMSGSEGRMIKFIGVHDVKSRVTGLKLTASGGNLTTGNIAVYGVRN